MQTSSLAQEADAGRRAMRVRGPLIARVRDGRDDAPTQRVR